MQRQALNLDRISVFCAQSPDLSIFNAPSANEYIFLLFEIERTMEQDAQTKLTAHQAMAIIREFYAKKDLIGIDDKTSNVLKLYIENYQVLRDFYEGRERFVAFTSLGRELLNIVRNRISESPRLSGLSIEQFFNDITALAQYNPAESRDQKIQKAKSLLEEQAARIARAEAGDEDALAELGTQMSPEEYLVDAERQQQYTLLAGEDVKKAIKDTRNEIVQSTVSVGRNIKIYSAFNETLKSKPAYKSYTRAKDLVSHIDALSSRNPYKVVSKALRQIQALGIISDERLMKSSLWQFNHQFDMLKKEIAEEENANLRLLAAQVRVTTSFDGKKLTEDLRELIQLISKSPELSEEYLRSNPVSYELVEPVAATDFKINSFQISEKVKSSAPVEDAVTDEDRLMAARQLAESEERTFKAVMKSLKQHIAEHGSIRISDLEFSAGLMEFIFIYFAPDLGSEFLGEVIGEDSIEFVVSDKRGPFKVTNLKDKLLFLNERVSDGV